MNQGKMTLRRTRPDAVTVLLKVLVWGAAACTLLSLALLIGYVLVRGVPHIKPSLFSLTYTSDNVSLLPSVITTVQMTVASLAIAVPLGVLTAVYLVEYARRGSRVVSVMRLTAETLSGIPSILYGLFGMLLFVSALGWGLSLLAGALTLSIMILPLIIRTTEEALCAVPDPFREASFGLGAGRLRTVFRVVLPAALPGILGGVILGIGRIVGETAALIYTAGSVPQVPADMLSSGRTLSMHMYILSSEGLHTDQAYATAVVLLVLVLGINTVSAMAAKGLSGVKRERKRG